MPAAAAGTATCLCAGQAARLSGSCVGAAGTLSVHPAAKAEASGDLWGRLRLPSPRTRRGAMRRVCPPPRRRTRGSTSAEAMSTTNRVSASIEQRINRGERTLLHRFAGLKHKAVSPVICRCICYNPVARPEKRNLCCMVEPLEGVVIYDVRKTLDEVRVYAPPIEHHPVILPNLL